VIGNELEQDIISLYSKDISSIYSINQIATKLGKKYPYINKKVSVLIKNNIFRKTIIGHSYLCSLNLKNEETIYLLILNEIRKKKAALQKEEELQEIVDYVEKAKKILPIELVLKTDDKIFFVLENEEGKELFEKAMVKQAMKEYKVKVQSKSSFLKELIEEKDILDHHVILLGYEKYYEYIRKVEDELKLRYSKLMP
jgi:hypothetical protein